MKTNAKISNVDPMLGETFKSVAHFLERAEEVMKTGTSPPYRDTPVPTNYLPSTQQTSLLYKLFKSILSLRSLKLISLEVWTKLFPQTC
jgi:hypothetical protein